ncbi:Protein of unknown function [Pyronema omphalodes CBS 100304]|uniref:Uncharacterized protein n=1 Tax=Pyronema omphalodes (strain CBS 100304) TaxID=1076935 RepID=U4L1L2_PYROM|nr:Protein of unknown function [Pyronema omphalodes CBS 100304]
MAPLDTTTIQVAQHEGKKTKQPRGNEKDHQLRRGTDTFINETASPGDHHALPSQQYHKHLLSSDDKNSVFLLHDHRQRCSISNPRLASSTQFSLPAAASYRSPIFEESFTATVASVGVTGAYAYLRKDTIITGDKPEEKGSGISRTDASIVRQ